MRTCNNRGSASFNSIVSQREYSFQRAHTFLVSRYVRREKTEGVFCWTRVLMLNLNFRARNFFRDSRHEQRVDHVGIPFIYVRYVRVLRDTQGIEIRARFPFPFSVFSFSAAFSITMRDASFIR